MEPDSTAPQIDTRLEEKLGFNRVRTLIADRCSTDYAASRVETETFCTDPDEIRRRLSLTDEMRLILLFEESFPTTGYIDCIGFLEPIANNASIDLLSLGKLKTLIDTVRKIRHFFSQIKDGVYPGLKRLGAGHDTVDRLPGRKWSGSLKPAVY